MNNFENGTERRQRLGGFVWNSARWNKCPYCKGDLRCISDHVVGTGDVANCPFCKKKIYGSRGDKFDRNDVGWTSEHPFKMMIICIVAVILVTVFVMWLMVSGKI